MREIRVDHNVAAESELLNTDIAPPLPRIPSRAGPAMRHSVLGCFAALARNVETEPSAWLAAFTFVYLITTIARSAKPLFFEEITTFYLARLDGISATWRAISSGADLEPPLMVVLVHLSQGLLGTSEIATRLPALVGVLAACACTFAFIKRRSGTIFAFCGAMLIVLSGAYRYATEARPWGVAVAGAAIALVSWQRADEPNRTWLPVGGLAVGLWIALASQCFSILLALPFGAGELVRSVKRKRIDWPVWIAFALSTSALAFYPPLFRTFGRGFAGHFPTFAPTFRSLWTVPSHLIGGAGRVAAAVMLLIVWLRRSDRTDLAPRSRQPAPGTAPPPHETVAVVLLTAIPVFLIILVVPLQSPLFYRYALAAVLGMAILIARAFERAAGGDSRIGVVVLLLLAGIFVERFVSDAFGAPDGQPPAKLVAASGNADINVQGNSLLSMATGDLPLVVSNPFWFPQVAHYAPPALADRTYYLTEADAAIRFTRPSPVEIMLPRLLRLNLPGHVTTYSVFTATHRRFLVYTSSNLFDWLMERLQPDNATFRFIGRTGDAMLLEACLQCETTLSQ